ncbi:hypothetical protein RV00_GL002292 [Enterococcus devriesei]|uniref:Putative host cell surface-exposed lipoprotein Ltp-like HTH region domain-containing protein n=1 Tax=Enterococcus devriesei TaxID=319970 RepID=A0A1L8SW14_9ENTE|nr:Ltp family lipoprotein [Enterococcus devriesei]OJG36148.1 hypothetical protein RV00_GL002292 [Enterococcus devriesei]
MAASLGAEEQENLGEDTTQSSVLPDIQQETAEIEAAPKAVPTKAETPADTLVELETIESSQPAKESASDVPSDYCSALRSAKSYSDRMHMSKAGIYDQLTSEYGEKFTATEANYAIQNLP